MSIPYEIIIRAETPGAFGQYREKSPQSAGWKLNTTTITLVPGSLHATAKRAGMPRVFRKFLVEKLRLTLEIHSNKNHESLKNNICTKKTKSGRPIR